MEQGAGAGHYKALESQEGCTRLVRLWGEFEGLCWLQLQPSLLLQLLDQEEQDGLLLSLPSSYHALASMLQKQGFKVSKTSEQGQRLLWRSDN